MAQKKSKETPLNKQYNQIKAKYPGALLLFRVGDFYETFGEDAVKASKILGIVLTKRNNGGDRQELAGFPHHSLDNYLPKLVRAGERVAICDQLEDPKSVKGIVKRGVTELVTPGVSYNDNVLETKQNNYLASVHFGQKDNFGISFLDISTGEFLTTEGSAAYIDKLLQSFAPAEVIFCKLKQKQFFELFGTKFNTYTLDDWAYTFDFSYPLLTQHFNTNNLKGFGVENLRDGVTSAGVILQYLKDTEHREIKHISSLTRLDEDKYVWLDKFTVRNLELVFPQNEGGVPLIDILDKTITPMGGRLLRKWMVLPLKELKPIQDRQDTVEVFVENRQLLEDLQTVLKPIGDVERLISKVAVGRISPREMVQLNRALHQIGPLKGLLSKLGEHGEIFQLYYSQLADCQYLIDRIDKEIKEDAPHVSNRGGILKSGVDGALDEYHKIAFSGKDYLVDLQQRESQKTSIPSLKIAYNKVFGYYLEVSNAHKDKVPEGWIRKQTLVNAERYITEELKEYEEKILTAESKIFEIEQRLYHELVLAANEFIDQIQQNARVISTIDTLASFAAVALANNYKKPSIDESKTIDIKGGRHPVIEKQLPLGESYVPNDLLLSEDEQQIIIVTGPNMAGKSALLRQTALIVLLAQIGSFVPAEASQIGLVDKIFTRVGASDNLSRGESTFMVEMTETASILNNLSDRSLVIMDEIGRGTSTYDGVSIAWSISEFLHNHPKFNPRTLFATHYHELNQLTEDFSRIKNFNVAVKELGGKIVFLRKLKPGGSEHSFGIHVAQLAGMPQSVVLRASEILNHLEEDHIKEKRKEKINEMPKNNYQLSFFDTPDPKIEELKEKLRSLDVNSISPIDALLKLNELKRLLD
ncbi:DNA mismatch repair protein MutS [Marinilongibacter aquaticus]|uniref:DNA mismatch repair protein MutS n=1 Tax=Marinilongibacter aquaticus TaxID=2975157 RepID=UPI0021BDC874|nr:DNA mismatch repair protein MutS [Marinilongibacter aquaticus]UBM60240.1 DNA mismatch repair protein MutS [Marinilongibacter aquaticus]